MRRTLLENTFTDNFSLNPKNNIPVNSTLNEETERLNLIVKLKRENTNYKFDHLEKSRQKTASLDPELLLKQAIEKSQNEVLETEFEAIVDRYKRGDHILGNIAKEQQEDVNLEPKYHQTAALVISQSQSMTTMLSKNEKELINQFEATKSSRIDKKHEKLLKKRQKNINEMSVRLKSYQKYLDARTIKLVEVVVDLDSTMQFQM